MGGHLAAHGVVVGVVAGLWILLRGVSLVPGDYLEGLDLPFSMALALLPLFLSAFLLGGARTVSGRGAFSLTAAVLGASASVISLLPVFFATTLAAVHVGSLHLMDYVRAQAAWPNGWLLLTSPLSLVLALSYLLALVPLAGRRPPLSGARERHRSIFLFARTVEWAGHVLLVGLWVVLFAGGTQGAAVSSWQGGGILTVKVLLVLQLLTWARRASGYVRRGEVWGVWGTSLVGASVVAAGLAFVLHLQAIRLERLEEVSLVAAYMLAFGFLGCLATLRAGRARAGRTTDVWI